jgi:hypothetical protein
MIMKKLMIFALFFMGFSMYSTAQEKMQYFRAQDKTGINTFETTKDNDVEFDGVKVKIGGANTLQFQALDHENSGATDIFDIGSNFNLATANLDLDVQLYDGMRMHLRTYLSSRHHAQPYVKGGYLQVDKLDFIREDFLSSLMDHVTVKFGHMQTNYGDAHFRRSDNGQTIFNPFVGNYIMDAFTTEIGGEVYYQSNGFIGMLGFTNGKLNQNVREPAEGAPETKLSLIGKIGYDSQINDDLRLRITGSVYHTPESARTYLYAGDRAGARYYNILTDNPGEFRIPRYDPGFNNELTAIMINPFVKYGGLEFFGMLEFSSGKAAAAPDTRDFTQLGAELLYRFGADENLYIGGRYNNVSGDTPAGESIDITRLNFGGGWFLTKNVLTKVEYVVQTYDGFNETSNFHEAEFSGFVLEAVISF